MAKDAELSNVFKDLVLMFLIYNHFNTICDQFLSHHIRVNKEVKGLCWTHEDLFLHMSESVFVMRNSFNSTSDQLLNKNA